jgi:lipid A 3-O-deacylase
VAGGRLSGTNRNPKHWSAVRCAAIFCAACLVAAAIPQPARAGELFGGVYVHDVKTPLDKSGIEGGADVQLGWRGGRIGSTPLQPYVFGALNTAGDTSYAAAGLSARFGKRLFVRPGVGIAIHNGSAKRFQDPTSDKIDFGSRVLFEPELGIGFDVNGRMSIEASLVHMSHAQLFSRQNPGIDNFGARLTLRL